MKNYCNNCKVTLDPSLSHCPLCGKCCNAETIPKEILYSQYPERQYTNDTRRTLINALTFGLLFSMSFCVLLEIVISKTVNWSIYLLASCILAIFSVILPLKRHWSLAGSLANGYLFFCGFIWFLEEYTHTSGWGVEIVIPFFTVAMCITCIMFLSLKLTHKWSFIFPLIIIILFSSAIFIYNLIANLTMWPILIALITALGTLLSLLSFKYRKTTKAIKKSFHF